MADSLGGLALFDFDGTLTDRDSFMDFLRRNTSLAGWCWGLLRSLPAVLAWKLGLRSRQRAKERVLAIFLGGMDELRLRKLCQLYARERVLEILRPAALRKLAWHQREGHRVVIVSASPGDWIEPWAQPRGIEVVASRLQIVDGRVTGALDQQNCIGAEKVRRLQALLNPPEYSPIFAYGDSSGDRELLALAEQPEYRPFRD